MEGKLRENAGNAVKAILETAGFEIQEVNIPVDFSAMREGEALLVLCSNNPSEIVGFDQAEYRLRVGEEELDCEKLVFTLEDHFRTEQSILWGVKEFVQYAGEAALARILERTLSLSFTSRRGESLAVIKEEASAEATSGISIPHLPIKITKQAAEQIAGMQGNITLRFIPHWIYQYQSSGEQVYKDQRVAFDAQGGGAINAINGLSIDADGRAITEGEIPVGAEVIKPHLAKEEAAERVNKELIDRLTKTVRIKQVKGDTIFYEEKVIKPDRKNIQVDIRQMYVPVWEIRGKKIVEINAFTGEILSQPMDEGVEIL
ncbi:MAG: hypothetical protein LUO81_02425 [Methanoregulaceae archaeon]|nr:hypothetical protein [Methanoregulaceae archaeon]